MKTAVELYFDPDTENAIRTLRRALLPTGVPSFLDTLGECPHISLGIFEETPAPLLLSIAGEMKDRFHPFEIALGSIGLFASEEFILFLAPVPSHSLLTIHEEFHAKVKKVGADSVEYYRPGHWVPHCTIEIGVPMEHRMTAMENCRRMFAPLNGTVQEIGVVECGPVRKLARFEIGSYC